MSLRRCFCCDEVLLDGEQISFIGTGEYKQFGPEPNSFGIKGDFRVEGMYHPECLYYEMNGEEMDK